MFDSANAVETLKIFFSLTQIQIDRDLGGAVDDARRILREVDRFERQLYSTRITPPPPPPPRRAAYHHNKLLVAHALRKLDPRSDDLNVCRLTHATQELLFDVELAAIRSGRLCRLEQRLIEIERRHGMDRDKQDLYLSDMPPEWSVIYKESSRLLASVTDTLRVHTWRRYHFDAVADLYERDRMRFDVMHHVGKRQLAPAG